MNQKDELCKCVVDCQRTLYAYILKLLPNANDANDVLQETNLILLGKKDEFSKINNFGAWAARIAYFQVLSFRSRKRRGKLFFDDELLKLMAEESVDDVSPSDTVLRCLGLCLVKLKERDQELLKLRYTKGCSVATIANEVGRTARAISQALYRIRSALMKCVDQTLHLQVGRD